MKKIVFITISIFIFGLAWPIFSFAQGVSLSDDDHTAREEAEGKAVWEKLQVKEVTCNDLSDNDFVVLGEYFMGQMTGDSHKAMNNMMIQMMGAEGEEQMHLAMGKRMSNCEPNAPMTQNMMNMMRGGGNSMMGNMMSGSSLGLGTGWSPMAGFGWIFMILFWVLIIAGIAALIKWLVTPGRGEYKDKPVLDILKERYAKGEIDKKEFEEKKKDLT